MMMMMMMMTMMISFLRFCKYCGIFYDESSTDFVVVIMVSRSAPPY